MVIDCERRHGDEPTCRFPKEANLKGISMATVILRVKVASDGRAERVWVMSDPGQGFGRMAAMCSCVKHYRPAKSATGKPVAATATYRFKFQRPADPALRQ
ncbi:MAG: energy transducer TonB [Myxococcota bacterium]